MFLTVIGYVAWWLSQGNKCSFLAHFFPAKGHIDKRMAEISERISRGEKVEGKYLTYYLAQEKLSMKSIYGNVTELLLAGVDTVSILGKCYLRRFPPLLFVEALCAQLLYWNGMENAGRFKKGFCGVSAVDVHRAVVSDNPFWIISVCFFFSTKHHGGLGLLSSLQLPIWCFSHPFLPKGQGSVHNPPHLITITMWGRLN